MLGRISPAVLVVVLLLGTSSGAQADHFVNGSFETGNLSGWTSYIPSGGYIQLIPSGAGKSAVDGSKFALLKTNGPGSYTSVWQTFTAKAGDRISGWAFFNAGDYIPYNDNSQVYIRSGNVSGPLVATVFSANVYTVGSYGQTPWTHWEYEFTAPGTYTVQGRIANASDSGYDSYFGVDGFVFEHGTIEVALDIRPGSDPNPINLKSKGVIPVAILTTDDFDASTVNGATVLFAGAGIAHGGSHLEDVDGDGDIDWVGHFRTQDTNIASGDTDAGLVGQTNDGKDLEGSDSIKIPNGSGKGKNAAKIAFASEAGDLVFGVSNYPNPFNPETTIRYILPEASGVRLAIYNVLGQQVRVLVDAAQGAGVYGVQWDGRDAFGSQVSSGMYLYRLETGADVAVRKMILAK